jgi:hypothetical protein
MVILRNNASRSIKFGFFVNSSITNRIYSVLKNSNFSKKILINLFDFAIMRENPDEFWSHDFIVASMKNYTGEPIIK